MDACTHELLVIDDRGELIAPLIERTAAGRGWHTRVVLPSEAREAMTDAAYEAVMVRERVVASTMRAAPFIAAAREAADAAGRARPFVIAFANFHGAAVTPELQGLADEVLQSDSFFDGTALAGALEHALAFSAPH